MFKRYLIWLLNLGILIMISENNNVYAQNSSYEFWPESDIWYRLSSVWRLSSYIALTKYNETKYRDLNITFQGDFAWGKTKRPFFKRLMDENRAQKFKSWLARGGFMEGSSLGENAGAYKEKMLFTEIHKRVPLKKDILLSQRFRVDTRWVGDDSKFSYRFRYRIMIEKEYEAGKTSIVPYVNVEPYWDSRYKEVNRVRIIGGVTASTGKVFAYEGNLTYQYDSHYDTNNLYVINLILHIYFETKRSKANTTGYNGSYIDPISSS